MEEKKSKLNKARSRKRKFHGNRYTKAKVVRGDCEVDSRSSHKADELESDQVRSVVEDEARTMEEFEVNHTTLNCADCGKESESGSDTNFMTKIRSKHGNDEKCISISTDSHISTASPRTVSKHRNHESVDEASHISTKVMKRSSTRLRDKIQKGKECELCGKVFKTDVEYLKHFIIVHTNLQCLDCGKECICKAHFMLHAKSIDIDDTHLTEEDLTECPLCHDFVLGHAMSDPMNQGLYQCCSCEKLFQNCSSLSKHVDKTHHKSSIVSKKTGKIDSSNTILKCQYCEKIFVGKGAFQRHRKTPRSTELCNDCGFTTKSKAILSLHQHYGHVQGKKDEMLESFEKKLTCHFCGLAYRRSRIIEHIESCHTGEYPYKCCVCAMPFLTETSWSEHAESHSSPGTLGDDDDGGEISIANKLISRLVVKNANVIYKESVGINEESINIDEENININEEDINIDEENININEESANVNEKGVNANEKSVNVNAESDTVSIDNSGNVNKENSDITEKAGKVDNKDSSNKSKTGNLGVVQEGNANNAINQDSANVNKAKKCSLCKEHFLSETDFISHLRNNAKPNQKECTICKTLTFTDSGHILHQYLSHGSSPDQEKYLHPSINRVSWDENSSFTNAKENERVQVECPCCPRIFCINDLQVHVMETHTLESPFQCCCCENLSPGICHFLDHCDFHLGRKMFGPGSYWCHKCDLRFETKGVHWMHKKMHKKIACKLCKAVFISELSLKNHVKAQHTNLSCSICGKIYSNRKILLVHKKRHVEGSLKRQCPKCGGMFVNLKDHYKRMHPTAGQEEESKAFVCHVCGKICKESIALRRHSFIHSNDRPFHCKVCPLKFKSQHYLNKHEKIHSERLMIVCKVCGKKCATATNMRIHMRVHSVIKLFPCDYCSQGFNYKQSLLAHIRSKHGTTSGNGMEPQDRIW